MEPKWRPAGRQKESGVQGQQGLAFSQNARQGSRYSFQTRVCSPRRKSEACGLALLETPGASETLGSPVPGLSLQLGQCQVRPDDPRRQAQEKPVPVALTGRACCCRMMGADWRWLFSSSARSLEFSASSAAYWSTGGISPVAPREVRGQTACEMATDVCEMGFPLHVPGLICSGVLLHSAPPWLPSLQWLPIASGIRPILLRRSFSAL